MIRKGELTDLAFALYFVFYIMVWVKVFVQWFKFTMFDFIVILVGNYLILQRCLLVRRIDRMCAAFKNTDI